jgi:hypothetical protein
MKHFKITTTREVIGAEVRETSYGEGRKKGELNGFGYCPDCGLGPFGPNFYHCPDCDEEQW